MLALHDGAFPLGGPLLPEINFFLRFSFKVQVEPESELSSLDEKVCEVRLVHRSVADNEKLVLGERDLTSKPAELGQLGFQVVHIHFVDGVSKEVTDLFFLLVKVTKFRLPDPNLIKNGADCFLNVFVPLRTLKEFMQVGNEFFVADFVLLLHHVTQTSFLSGLFDSSGGTIGDDFRSNLCDGLSAVDSGYTSGGSPQCNSLLRSLERVGCPSVALGV